MTTNCTSHTRQLIPQETHLIKSFQANPLLCFCWLTSCQHPLKYAFNSPIILKNTDSTVFNFNQLQGRHFSFHNNVLLGIQEAGLTSIIRQEFFHCNKYANEESQSVVFQIRLASVFFFFKDTNLLIASGQRNPITVGIDYKAVRVIIVQLAAYPGIRKNY